MKVESVVLLCWSAAFFLLGVMLTLFSATLLDFDLTKFGLFVFFVSFGYLGISGFILGFAVGHDASGCAIPEIQET